MSLNQDDLRRFLTGAQGPLETLDWLSTTFLPEVQVRLNSDDVRRRVGLYSGERIPENERNLTDVRNRVSLIIEYELARTATELLAETGARELFWSYVVANRFPDLEVRNAEGNRGLRIEVKCLQSVAEEKAANFDTLRKDVHPQTDFLIVFLWEWKLDSTEILWDRAPKIEKVYVFHAASLALLRDRYWLNRPPTNPGDGLQGFDLRFAVNCNKGKFNEEEGNYGKLMRLWAEGFEYAPAMTAIVERSVKDYLKFQSEVISIGFDNLAKRILPELGKQEVNQVLLGTKQVGWRAGEFVFVFMPRLGNQAELIQVLQGNTGLRVFNFGPKYAWQEVTLESVLRRNVSVAKVQVVSGGKKPKYLVPYVEGSTLPLPTPEAIAVGQDES